MARYRKNSTTTKPKLFVFKETCEDYRRPK